MGVLRSCADRSHTGVAQLTHLPRSASDWTTYVVIGFGLFAFIFFMLAIESDSTATFTNKAPEIREDTPETQFNSTLTKFAHRVLSPQVNSTTTVRRDNLRTGS